MGILVAYSEVDQQYMSLNLKVESFEACDLCKVESVIFIRSCSNWSNRLNKGLRLDPIGNVLSTISPDSLRSWRLILYSFRANPYPRLFRLYHNVDRKHDRGWPLHRGSVIGSSTVIRYFSIEFGIKNLKQTLSMQQIDRNRLGMVTIQTTNFCHLFYN